MIKSQEWILFYFSKRPFFSILKPFQISFTLVKPLPFNKADA